MPSQPWNTYAVCQQFDGYRNVQQTLKLKAYRNGLYSVPAEWVFDVFGKPELWRFLLGFDIEFMSMLSDYIIKM